jgi:peptidylprolyl isomerase
VALAALGLAAGSRTGWAGQLDDGLYAEIQTSKGLILARLEPDRTPLAVASFVGLAEGTIANEAFEPGTPYYDGSRFHRVVPGHVIQAGAPDPQRSEARGPGYSYPNEIHAGLSHDHAGALGVANSGPHTNGAQFYVTLGDRSYLDGTYMVFGEVIEGMDVVHAIVQDDVVESVRIVRHGAAAEAFRPDTAQFEGMVAAAEERVRQVDRDRERLTREWISRNIGDERLMDIEGLRAHRRRQGEGAPVQHGERVRVRYTGTAVVYRGHMLGYAGPLFEEIRFAGSPEDGTPQNVDPEAPPFDYEVGSAAITPGFDRALETMRRGDEVLFVIPWQQAYQARGFYGPDLPGQRRFVIPPHTLVIYAIEVLE